MVHLNSHDALAHPPKAILPDYFSTVFRHVQSPPILRFPMPPIPPLVPRADEIFSSPRQGKAQITNDPLNPSAEFMPSPTGSLKSISRKSASSSESIYAPSISSAPQRASSSSPRPYTAPSSACPSARPSFESGAPSSSFSSTRPTIQLERSTSFTRDDAYAPLDPQKRHSVAALAQSETTTIGDARAAALFRVERMQALPSDNLFMHLYQAVHTVLAVREAMWEELRKRVEAGDRELGVYGWEEGDYDVEVSRERFDALLERYRG